VLEVTALASLNVFSVLTRGSLGLFLAFDTTVILDLLLPVDATALVDLFEETFFADTALVFVLLLTPPVRVADVLVFDLVDLVVFAMREV